MTSIKQRDRGRGRDKASFSDVIAVTDHLRFRTQWDIVDFLDADGEVTKASRAGMPNAELERVFTSRIVKRQSFEGNLLLNEGINELWTLGCGTGATKFDNSNANIGVGDSNTAASASQTGLQASSNKLYKAMDGGYPTYGSSQQAVWRSTFATGDANFSWQEITVANGNSDSAKNLNRKVQDMGTKTSAVSRVTTLTITLS
jgi:hypothetical protein